MAEAGFEARTDDPAALWRFVYGYPSGSWFVIPDPLTPIPGDKPHRWIIAEAARGEFAVDAFVRSRSSGTGLPHRPHEKGHAPTCKIDKPGRIVGRSAHGRTDLPWKLQARCFMDGTYSCEEPVPWYVSEVERMRAAAEEWAAGRSTAR